MIRTFYLMLFLSSIYILFAQENEDLNDEIISFLETNAEEENQSNSEDIVEQILSLRQSKVNLNNCNLNDLCGIPYLNESDALNILLHRKKYGKFFSLYELKHIPNMEKEKIIKILPFVTIDKEVYKIPFREYWKQSKSQLYVRFDRNIEKKSGYKPDSSNHKEYKGDPNHYYLKYRFKGLDKIDFGLTCEKDAGEPFWNNENKAADFYSDYLQLSNINFLKRLCIGDYKANYGQGLVIGTGSIFGKTNNILNTYNGQKGLHKYTSTNECNFFRGIGSTFSVRNLDFSLFVSHKNIDGNIKDGNITSFKTDGMHRTTDEIEKKHNSKESTAGANINFTSSHFTCGYTFLYYKYKHILSPSDKPYNLYKIKGTNEHWNMGINYTFHFYKMNFFGETAVDKKKGLATLNGVSVYPSSRIGLLLLYRNYQPQYQAQFANAFSENSRIENEIGYYIGSEFLPFPRIKISMYADIYKFPWIRYNTKSPTNGYEYLFFVSYNTNRRCNMQLKYKQKKKTEEKQTLRYCIKTTFSKISFQSLIEGNMYQNEDLDISYGWMAAQDINFNLFRNKLSIFGRYAYFHAPAYNNRLYVYEKDILQSFSIPCHYGIGHRLALCLQFKINDYLTLYMKYNTFIYADDRTSCSSGNEEVQGNRVSGFKGLLKWQF